MPSGIGAQVCKDDVCLHWAAVSAVQRIGNYWHMLPEAAQARKAIWEAVNPHTGVRRIDEAFPHEIRANTRENEMMIRFKNGSTWQVVGSDNFNSLVGSPPVGVVFSEWALANPAAWAYIRPILAENGGWAFFITTPRGRNHAFTMYEGAKHDPDWYAERLSADTTGVFTQVQLSGELREYLREYGDGAGQNLFDQEYMVSFEAAILGAYWGKELRQADEQGRLGSVPIDPALPVHTAWDLGTHDDTAIWCFQMVGRDIHVVDFYANNGQGLKHYTDWLDERGYHGDNWLPHDARHHIQDEMNRTRSQILQGLGRKLRLVPNQKIMDGINAARLTLPRCRFDAERCARGLECLRQYRAGYDDRNRVFLDSPKHDWTSHAADAFRYLSLSWRETAVLVAPPMQAIETPKGTKMIPAQIPFTKPAINTLTVSQYHKTQGKRARQQRI